MQRKGLLECVGGHLPQHKLYATMGHPQRVFDRKTSGNLASATRARSFCTTGHPKTKVRLQLLLRGS